MCVPRMWRQLFALTCGIKSFPCNSGSPLSFNFPVVIEAVCKVHIRAFLGQNNMNTVFYNIFNHHSCLRVIHVELLYCRSLF